MGGGGGARTIRIHVELSERRLLQAVGEKNQPKGTQGCVAGDFQLKSDVYPDMAAGVLSCMTKIQLW